MFYCVFPVSKTSIVFMFFPLLADDRGGHLQTCKHIIEAGVDTSPSCFAVNNPCELTPLMAAAQYGHDSVVRYLLDCGFDVNYRAPSTG